MSWARLINNDYPVSDHHRYTAQAYFHLDLLPQSVLRELAAGGTAGMFATRELRGYPLPGKRVSTRSAEHELPYRPTVVGAAEHLQKKTSEGVDAQNGKWTGDARTRSSRHPFPTRLPCILPRAKSIGLEATEACGPEKNTPTTTVRDSS